MWHSICRPSSARKANEFVGDGVALLDLGNGHQGQFYTADAWIHSHSFATPERSVRLAAALFALLYGLAVDHSGRRSRALEAAFRQHASSISAPTPSDGLSAIAVDGKTLRGSFDAFSDRKAAHMMSALRQADQIVLGHLMVAEKSNEIPAAPELIEALGLKGCVFTLDAEHAQKIVRARDRLGQSPADPGQG